MTIYIYDRLYEILSDCTVFVHFCFVRRNWLCVLFWTRTSGRLPYLGTIKTNWNEINKVIVDATHDESKKKTFTGYIDEIWKEAIADSDKGVKTGKKPVKKEKK